MEKQLSAGQRDQAYLSLARQELVMKQTMASSLADATLQSSKAFESLSKSIENAGKSIGDGLALIANALGGNRPQDRYAPPPSHYGNSAYNGYYHPPTYNQPHGNNINNTDSENSGNKSYHTF